MHLVLCLKNLSSVLLIYVLNEGRVVDVLPASTQDTHYQDLACLQVIILMQIHEHVMQYLYGETLLVVMFGWHI